jgi:hypothetical protein
MRAINAQSKRTQPHRKQPSLTVEATSSESSGVAYRKPAALPVCLPIRRRSSKRSAPPAGPLHKWTTDQVAEFLADYLGLTSATVQADFRKWVMSRSLKGTDLLNITEPSLRRDGLNRMWIEGILEASEECRKMVATMTPKKGRNDDIPSVVTVFEETTDEPEDIDDAQPEPTVYDPPAIDDNNIDHSGNIRSDTWDEFIQSSMTPLPIDTQPPAITAGRQIQPSTESIPEVVSSSEADPTPAEEDTSHTDGTTPRPSQSKLPIDGSMPPTFIKSTQPLQVDLTAADVISSPPIPERSADIPSRLQTSSPQLSLFDPSQIPLVDPTLLATTITLPPAIIVVCATRSLSFCYRNSPR